MVVARGMSNTVNEHHQIAGYDVVSTLGKGARSTLFEVRDKHGDLYCLKRVVKEGPSDQRFIDQAVAEHEVSQNFDHPRLRKSIKLIRQRALIRTTEVFVLMELVRGRTLETYNVGDLTVFCSIATQIGEAMEAMHKAGYVHADMKPNNVLVTDQGEVKVIDFGQSCTIGTIKERIQGTPDYIAPEQVLRRAITAQTDVFNLGATMYWLVTGKYVPTLIPKTKTQPGTVKSALHDKPKRATPPIELVPELPPALSTLIMDCIEEDPRNRPDEMSRVLDRLEIASVQLSRLNGHTSLNRPFNESIPDSEDLGPVAEEDDDAAAARFLGHLDAG